MVRKRNHRFCASTGSDPSLSWNRDRQENLYSNSELSAKDESSDDSNVSYESDHIECDGFRRNANRLLKPEILKWSSNMPSWVRYIETVFLVFA
ncbi:unnamed protein product [Litomosoides sigmodontis]|uniref:Uncharacterized protein n=1 Tax=Litomosoides sigmodontis TaxID=42156 RepID=A0A3P7JU12_LITSI|nr:unnamed protein product [Litomosoides sigmodontis]